MTSTNQPQGYDFSAVWWPAFEQMLQFQQQQWLSLLAWQESLLAMQNDLYDQWLSRCADGARLDD